MSITEKLSISLTPNLWENLENTSNERGISVPNLIEQSCRKGMQNFNDILPVTEPTAQRELDIDIAVIHHLMFIAQQENLTTSDLIQSFCQAHI